MPESRYTQLDKKLDTVIATLSENKTSVAVLSEHMASVDKNVGALADHVGKQNGRIRKLENWRAGVVAVGAFMGVAGKMLFDLLTK